MNFPYVLLIMLYLLKTVSMAAFAREKTQVQFHLLKSDIFLDSITEWFDMEKVWCDDTLTLPEKTSGAYYKNTLLSQLQIYFFVAQCVILQTHIIFSNNNL